MQKDSVSPPFVSVLMPVRNEGTYIQRSLESVLNQNYPAEKFEIIIADGKSEDGTLQILQDYRSHHSNVSIIENPEQIVSTGLNRAMKQARGEIIVRIDGHCRVNPNHISRCVLHLQSGYDAVGGSIESVGETIVQQAIAAAMSSKFGVGNSSFRTTRDKNIEADTVPFPAYKRTIIEKAGPYDEELVRNQDDEFNFRLRKLGIKVLLAGDLRCEYYIRHSYFGLWRQFYHYGFWKVRVLQKHPRQMQLRHFVPPLFVGIILILLLALPFSSFAAALLAGILVSYMIVSLFASLAVVRDTGWKSLPLVLFAFWTLHFSYGSGFLHGLYNFRKNWN